MPINKFCLFNSVFWSSVLLVMPAAIAQEVKPSSNSENATFVNLNLSGLEVTQVRPTFRVSGPPVPSYPALTDTQPTSVSEPTTPPSTSAQPANRWHFLIQPYVYLPISVYGDATVKGFTTDIALDAGDIFSSVKNTFEFGLTGRLEAWTPNYHLGFLFGGEYMALGKNSTSTRPNPNRLLDLAINRVEARIQARVDERLGSQIADYLQGRLDGQIRQEVEARLGARLEDVIPSEFESDVQIEAWSIDLAVAYRFYNESRVTPQGVATEFDLGPFLFDVIGGVRIGGISGDLDVETNLGGEGSFSRSVTIAKPLISARFRYNLSRNLATVIAGSVAGFGIGDLGLQWEVMSGLDWMFSGNTSVGIGYRFAYLEYETGSGRDEFDVSLSNNGPYLSFTFRF